MEFQIQISDLENIISEKIFIKIEKWNLYLGDAGLARNLAIECISNKDQGTSEAAKISLKAINVKVGDGINNIPLINLITTSQILELEEILESFSFFCILSVSNISFVSSMILSAVYTLIPVTSINKCLSI